MEFKKPTIKETPLEDHSFETAEPNETKKNVIEKAKKERFKLAFDVSLRLLKLASHAIDLTPIGNLKMGTEAILGKTSTGEKLNTKDRIMYSLILLHSFIYTTLLGYGILKGDVNAVMLSAPVYAITVGLTMKQKGPQIKKDIPEFIKKHVDLLNEHLVNSKKIIEKRIKDIKPDDNK